MTRTDKIVVSLLAGSILLLIIMWLDRHPEMRPPPENNGFPSGIQF
jgi:hypothetical protein